MKEILQKCLNFISALGSRKDDSEKTRQEKIIIVIASIVSASTAFLFGLIYSFQGAVIAGRIAFTGSFVFIIFFIVFIRTGNITLFKFVVFLIYLTVPSSTMWYLGGFYTSSFMIIWVFLAALLALITSTQKRATKWFFAYLFLLLVSGIIQTYLPKNTFLSEEFITLFIVINIALTSIIIYLVMQYFINQKNKAYHLLTKEQEKSDSLLLNVLPLKIANLLKEKDQIIADQYKEASVLFADLVGFTQLTESLSPKEMISLLNKIYSHFDSLADKYGLEKIRTMGDNYMVASGVPTPRQDHAEAIAKMALEIIEFIKSQDNQNGLKLNFRIGINSGPLIAGVIGKKKFHYDIWGDTVNTASRMESHGVPGKIQVTENTYYLLKNKFRFESRGPLKVKGKGTMETWFLMD